MAPEIKAKKAYDGKKADIFSAGVILFCLATCRMPFYKGGMDDLMYLELQKRPL